MNLEYIYIYIYTNVPYENSEKKISVATAFCPLVSFVRAPRTKKENQSKKKVKRSKSETPTLSLINIV